jgi:hypothetical protein
MRRDFLATREGIACHREIRKNLSQALRAAYESSLSEELPDHLANLLQRLDRREQETSASGSRRRSPRSDIEPRAQARMCSAAVRQLPEEAGSLDRRRNRLAY